MGKESGLRYGGFVIYKDVHQFVAEPEYLTDDDHVFEIGCHSVDGLVIAIDEIHKALARSKILGIERTDMAAWIRNWISNATHHRVQITVVGGNDPEFNELRIRMKPSLAQVDADVARATAELIVEPSICDAMARSSVSPSDMASAFTGPKIKQNRKRDYAIVGLVPILSVPLAVTGILIGPIPALGLMAITAATPVYLERKRKRAQLLHPNGAVPA